ncbi:MAG: hypothetical protein J6Q73_09735 [Bacteroidaceae bacterium]|nr:hypothetical protein [Bacteroidaceae bacterium]
MNKAVMLFLFLCTFSSCKNQCDCCIATAALNERYYAIEDSIMGYVRQLQRIEDECCADTLDSERLALLGVTGLALQESLVNYVHKVVDENVGNSLGLYLLVVYNDFFTTNELTSLIEDMSLSSVCDNRLFYDSIIDVLQSRLKR